MLTGKSKAVSFAAFLPGCLYRRSHPEKKSRLNKLLQAEVMIIPVEIWPFCLALSKKNPRVFRHCCAEVLWQPFLPKVVFSSRTVAGVRSVGDGWVSGPKYADQTRGLCLSGSRLLAAEGP